MQGKLLFLEWKSFGNEYIKKEYANRFDYKNNDLSYLKTNFSIFSIKILSFCIKSLQLQTLYHSYTVRLIEK